MHAGVAVITTNVRASGVVSVSTNVSSQSAYDGACPFSKVSWDRFAAENHSCHGWTKLFDGSLASKLKKKNQPK